MGGPNALASAFLVHPSPSGATSLRKDAVSILKAGVHVLPHTPSFGRKLPRRSVAAESI